MCKLSFLELLSFIYLILVAFVSRPIHIALAFLVYVSTTVSNFNVDIVGEANQMNDICENHTYRFNAPSSKNLHVIIHHLGVFLCNTIRRHSKVSQKHAYSA